MSYWQRPSGRPLTLRDTDIAFASDRREAERFQRIGEGHYVLSVPDLGTDLEVTQVHFERHECRALLTVHCGLSGARTVYGVLFHASVNLSSVRDRHAIAMALNARTSAAKVEQAQWSAVVDELAVRVYKAEREGSPAKLLSDVEPLPAEDWLWAYGFSLPKRHPSMIFGDGDSLKTYSAIAIAVDLARQGYRIGVCDWEMTDEEYRDRVSRLDTRQLDKIAYISCSRPLSYERDRIAEAIHEHELQYLIFDSVGFACPEPEKSSTATAYFRDVRSLGIGSLHLAHMTKGEDGDQKPFGSTFWFNAVRALWYAKRAEAGLDPNVAEVGFYPRKFNLGSRRGAFGLRFTFEDAVTHVQRIDATDVESLAISLPLRERIRAALRSGPRTIAELAEELGAKEATVKKAIQRAPKLFTRIEGPDGLRFAVAEFRRIK